jgi:hypothetical protein
MHPDKIINLSVEGRQRVVSAKNRINSRDWTQG